VHGRIANIVQQYNDDAEDESESKDMDTRIDFDERDRTWLELCWRMLQENPNDRPRIKDVIAVLIAEMPELYFCESCLQLLYGFLDGESEHETQLAIAFEGEADIGDTLENPPGPNEELETNMLTSTLDLEQLSFGLALQMALQSNFGTAGLPLLPAEPAAEGPAAEPADESIAVELEPAEPTVEEPAAAEVEEAPQEGPKTLPNESAIADEPASPISLPRRARRNPEGWVRPRKRRNSDVNGSVALEPQACTPPASGETIDTTRNQSDATESPALPIIYQDCFLRHFRLPYNLCKHWKVS